MSIWLVARVLVGQEAVVTSRLLRIGTESYAPRYCSHIIDKRTHRRRIVVRQLFPCYLFVRTQPFHWLTEIDGLTSIVMNGIGPARSSQLDRFVEDTRLSEVDGFVPEPFIKTFEPRFKHGSRVSVLRGLFRGHLGTCIESCNDNVHVRVSMDLFGREVPVVHSECDLAAV
jgi:transcription antitermination factor NusG